MTMKDGRKLGVRVVVHEKEPDLAWMVTEDVVDSIPFANLAATSPARGSKVWHMGYGIDKPGNREDGEVANEQNAIAKTKFILSVSPGDSGGGIFNERNEIVSTVCCTSAFAEKVSMYGATIERIRKARPGAVRLDQLPDNVEQPAPNCCP
jgi:hypothetical protein